MAEILDLDKHRTSYPLPCISGAALRWFVAPSTRFRDNQDCDDWDKLETYPVFEYVANAENGTQYTITFDSESGTFDVLHTNINKSGVLVGEVESLKLAKDIAESHRLIIALTDPDPVAK
jgi:hypothetical protein